MNKCLVCCQPVVRKVFKSVETNLWETVLKVLRKAENVHVGDVSGFVKCQLCELCLHFANRYCELIRLITELQSELNDIGGKLRCSFEKSTVSEDKVEEELDYVEDTLWVNARKLLGTCSGKTDQIIEVCPIWEECTAHSSDKQVEGGEEKANENDKNELAHQSQISDHHWVAISLDEAHEPSVATASRVESPVQLDDAEETHKSTLFRTFIVQGFVLKDLEIRVERLTEDFILSNATRQNSVPVGTVTDAKFSDEDSDSDYHGDSGSDGSAGDTCVEENEESSRDLNQGRRRFRCAMCNDRFDTYQQVSEHRAEKHPPGAPLSCTVCGKTYQLRKSLTMHMYRHMEGMSCKVCGKEFSYKHLLLKHEKEHTKGRPVRNQSCEASNQSFDSGTNLHEHRQSAHPEDPSQDELLERKKKSQRRDYSRKCEVCGKIFARKANYYQHMMIHRPRKHACDVCGKRFMRLADLRKHSPLHAKKSQDQTKSRQCQVCGKTYTRRDSYYHHIRYHRPGKHACEVCGKRFVKLAELRKHSATHTKENLKKSPSQDPKENLKKSPSQDPNENLKEPRSAGVEENLKKSRSGNRSLQCQLCGKIFNRTDSYHHHQMRFHRPPKHICEVCGKRFVLLVELRKHSATHTKEKPYTCELCGKQVIGLTPHLRICQEKRASEEEKTFKCSHCNKSFLLQESLRTHETYNHRDPSTETPFQCEVCHQYFKMKCFLVQHRRRAHFPEERLPCSMCSAKFVLPSELNWHIQYEHLGNREKCSICGHEASSKNAFDRHMRLHRHGRRHECKVCGKKFLTNPHLNRHKQIHEKDSVS